MRERDRRVARHFAILRRIQIQRQRPAAHRFNQRRMRAAHLRRMDIGERVRRQFPIAFAINAAGHVRIAQDAAGNSLTAELCDYKLGTPVR